MFAIAILCMPNRLFNSFALHLAPREGALLRPLSIFLTAMALTLALPSSGWATKNPTPSCSELLLWGGHLINRYEPFDFEKSPITLGIEVEGAVHKKIGRDGLRKMTLDYMKQRYDNAGIFTFQQTPAVVYNKAEKENNEYRISFKQEHTVSLGLSQEDVEITSPIMRDGEDLKEFLEVIEYLRRNGGLRTDPLSAAIHIHVGVPDASGPELALLANVFASVEEELFEAFSVAPHRKEKYAAPTAERIRYLMNKEAWVPSTPGPLSRLTEGRGHALNLWAYNSHRTVEFRLFNGTLNPANIVVMASLTEKLVYAVRSKSPNLIKLLASYHGPTIPLSELSEAIGFDLKGAQRTFKNVRREYWFARMNFWKHWSQYLKDKLPQ